MTRFRLALWDFLGSVRAMSATVALIEDDTSYREPLRELLGPRCVGAWPSVEAALPALAAATPNVLLLDVDLPGLPGHVAVPRLLAVSPATLVTMLTAHASDDLVFAALRAGAIGYLLKSASPEEILASIDETVAGGAPMSPAIARRVVAHFRGCPAPVDNRATSLAILTPRERELLELIVAGASDKEAAARLGITHGTARNSLSAVYRKLQVANRTEAILRHRR